MISQQSDIAVPELILSLGRAWEMDAEMVKHIYRLGFCDGQLKSIQAMMKADIDAVQVKEAVND